jgi:phosphoglycolate phosphatase-like HAD superfamily hydrolase
MKSDLQLLLFDIDMTLIDTAGAGRNAMIRSFEDLFSRRNGMESAQFAGSTDSAILREALEHHQMAWTAEIEEKFRAAYLQHLQTELAKPNPRKRVLPGILQILDILRHHATLKIGLLTGNWQAGARIKLEYFDLYRYFDIGAFSDDSAIRSELPAFAARRFAQKTGETIAPHNVYIIGDTPNDVACSRPFGARSVAVATGLYSVNQLQSTNPDFLFSDFSDHQNFFKIFE